MQERKHHLDQLLKSLRLTLTNIKIYPLNSPLVEQQINSLYSILKHLLQDNTFVAISEMDGKIFINDTEYQSKDPTSISNMSYIVQFFVQTGIKSITFKKELTINELQDIMIALTTKKPKLTTKEIVMQTIKEKDIKNISIDEVEYITVLKSDTAVRSILDKISQPVSDFPQLVSVLIQSFSELDKVQDEKTKKNMVNTIAKYVASHDINLIRDLFSQPLPEKIEQLGFKQQVINTLTKQQVEGILNEIIEWCKQIKKEAETEIEYIEKLQHVKEFIKLVVNSPVSKLLPIEVFEELFKIGLISALPEWVVQQKEEKKSWIQQLDELLSTNDPVKLVQEKFITNLQDNIEKLCIIGLDDKIDKLISLMTENLSNPVVKIRQLASSSLDIVSKQIYTHQKSKLAKNLAASIMKFLLREQDSTVVSQYLQSLKNSLSCLIVCKDYKSFIEYMQQLLLFAEEIQKTDPDKSKSIYMCLDKIYDETKSFILSSLAENDTENINLILQFLRYISERSIDTILSAIMESNNTYITNVLVQLLANMKDQQQVVKSIEELLSPQTPSHKVAKIIPILDKFDYDFSNTLKSLYNYTTYANKVAIINYVQQKPNDENLTWLVSLIKSKDIAIIEYVVDIITALGYAAAAEELLPLLKTKNIDLKKRVCICLGLLKETKAIPKLKKIASSKPGLFKKGEPLEVRIAACWSLGNFIMLPEIKKFFQKLVNNKKDKAIASIATEVLQQK